MFGVVVLVALLCAYFLPYVLFPTLDQPGALSLSYELAGRALVGSFAFMLIPLAIGAAVLRHRLYDIDILINRTLVYGSLTAMLLGLYFGGVATIQVLFSVLTGQEEQSQLAVVASTLVIAALFNPLRRRLQTFIDRRFYRRKYDARRTLEIFSARLRDETDLGSLNNELVGVVRETISPPTSRCGCARIVDRRAAEPTETCVARTRYPSPPRRALRPRLGTPRVALLQVAWAH